jgi:RimJ/RimL family protein N-acetyltransferase
MNHHDQFVRAKNTRDFIQIARLADTIWREHYIPIIGAGQVNYMLEKFQSADAMANQAAKGMEYYTVRFEDAPVGYFAFEKRGRELFLSKIYLLKEYRGKGLGKASMEFITTRAKGLDCAEISLTVNKYNDRSIKAYEGMGFRKTEEAVVDIGGGYVMDDYRMAKPLRNN